MKRYCVWMNRGAIGVKKKTNSLRFAQMLANLKVWDYAKIHDLSTGQTSLNGKLLSVGKCIYTKRK